MRRAWWMFPIFVLSIVTAVMAAETARVRLAGDVLGLGAAAYSAPLNVHNESAKA